MTTTALDQVAQRIAQREAELAALRRTYDDRKRKLAELTQRKQQLQGQLARVETDIQALTRGSVPPPVTKPVVAPKPSRKDHQRRAHNAVPLPVLLQNVLREAGRPLSHKQLTEEVTRRKYATTTGDLHKQITTRVGEMVRKGLLRRTKEGAATLPATVSTGAKSPPSPATAKTAPDKAAANKTPLRAMLTHLLAKSKQPLTGGELARQALAAGYQTSSQNFPNLVHVTITKMDNVQRVKGQGYRLKKR
jgi:hypothetical protein